MSADQNRAVARRVTFELFAGGNLAVMDQLTTPDFVNHGQTPGVPETEGRASLANAIQRVRAAFPDFRYELVHEVAEGDIVVHHLAASGTQTGPFAGAGPTGRSAKWREVHVMRFSGGKMVEQWGVVDRLSALQQLGLAPLPGKPPARPA
jgi:predicted ester cyclase